jgi:16S rRNA (adenine1518-N6/adenine1519-N6)-dimethyltransferase
MNGSEIKRIIIERGLRPNKKLGQNFLVSGEVRERIIEAMRVSREDRVLEVGPGLGALTERLIERAGHTTAVEIDAGFSRYLAERFGGSASFRLIHGDFLKDPPGGPFTKIVSNLPYYCSSEMLFSFTRYDAPHVYVMLQKEMADRIASAPGRKSYGALSVTLGFYYETKTLLKVSREAFYPRPEVASSFLALSRRAVLPLEGGDIALFHALVKSAFWGRRKTLLAALSASPHLGMGRAAAARMLGEARIDGGRRGEELGRDEFVALVKAYRKIELPDLHRDAPQTPQRGAF